MSDRRFTDEEFALILRKASELQERPAQLGSGSEEGLSLDEIKAVAGEVGIDPALVERAVSLLPRDPEISLLATLAGGPTRYRLEHTSPQPLTEADEARLLDVVRSSLKQHGKVLPGTPGLEWSNVGDVSQIYLTAVPTRDGTDLRVTADRTGGAILTLLFPTLAGVLLAVATGSALDPDSVLVGAGILAGGVGVGLGAARAIWATATRRIKRRLHGLMTDAAAALEEGGG